MTRKLLVAAVGLAALAALAAPALAADAAAGPAADPRVRQALDAAGLNYTVTDGGDFRLVMQLANGRAQVVLIPSRTYALQGVEIREIWSVANDYASGIPADHGNLLLERNARFKLGAFALRRFGDTAAAIFLAKVPAVSRADVLRSAIWAVAQSCDEAEETLTRQDRF